MLTLTLTTLAKRSEAVGTVDQFFHDASLIRIQCDEQEPHCANCISHNTTSTCIYPSVTSNKPHHPLRPRPPRQPLGCGNTPSLQVILSPSFLGAPSEITTLLQLELMHRWSTATYKAFIMVPPDADFMQIALPRGGIEHRFLLDGIMAVAALDIASGGHPQAARYSRRAMEFFDASSGSFRAQLTRVDDRNLEWVFLYSHISSLLSLALASAAPAHDSRPGSAVEATVTMFELLIGSAVFAHSHMAGLTAGPYAASILYTQRDVFATQTPTTLDAPTEECFDRLRTLADFLVANPHHVRCTSAPRLFGTWGSMYREAILRLHRCFAEDERGKIVGVCLGYPVMIGPDFIQGVRVAEPMALVLLMIWALLIDRMASLAWWAKDLGARLVTETTMILLKEEGVLAELPEYHECIVWANRQIGRVMPKVLSWAGGTP